MFIQQMRYLTPIVKLYLALQCSDNTNLVSLCKSVLQFLVLLYVRFRQILYSKYFIFRGNVNRVANI